MTSSSSPGIGGFLVEGVVHLAGEEARMALCQRYRVLAECEKPVGGEYICVRCRQQLLLLENWGAWKAGMDTQAFSLIPKK